MVEHPGHFQWYCTPPYLFTSTGSFGSGAGLKPRIFSYSAFCPGLSPSSSRISGDSSMAEVAGVDFAWGKPDANATRQCGYSFVLGYLSHDASKNLNDNELRAYLAAGLRVGLVWETYQSRASEGANAGAEDGGNAELQANQIGYAVDAPIFFAVDYDAQPGDIAQIRAYAEAFNKATRRPVGVYGSYYVVEALVTPGEQPVQFGWQAAAWSGDKLSLKANIYQRIGHVNWPVIPGFDADGFDEDVLCIDLPLMGTVAPAPAVEPVPVPAPAPIPAPVPAPPTPPPAPEWAQLPTIEYGDVDDASVASLQRFLAHNYPAYEALHGHLPATGNYLDVTQAWVEEFQVRSGVTNPDGSPADGSRVGDRTKPALWAAGWRG